jgi:arsenite methyltransferase
MNEPASFSYFDMQAFMGTTKHMGGSQSTMEMIRLLGIEASDLVLDVGCGAGATAVHLAGEIGCRVMAVDLRESMLVLTRQRAQKEGLLERIEMRQANATQLPFEDETFDAVVCESVLTFVEDRQQAIGEFARLVKQDGAVGLNEQFWIQPPTDEMRAYTHKVWEFNDLPSRVGWTGFMEQAGLHDIQSRGYQMDARREASQVERYGLSELWRMFSRTARLYLENAQFRTYMKDRMKMPKGLFDHLGYGIFAGKK